MARPMTWEDVVENAELYGSRANSTEEIGQINLADFITSANLTKAWSDFVKALEHNGFEVSRRDTYGAEVRIERPLNEKEKEDNLGRARYRWDELKGIYDICSLHGTPPENYEKRSLTTWCKVEGLEIPWKEDEEN